MSLFRKDVSEEETVTGSEEIAAEETVKKERLSRKERKARKKAEESIEDAYDEDERTLHGDDAHRDVTYDIASSFKQMRVCYMTQMKRFTKERTIWTLLILLILIPVIYYALSMIGLPKSNITNVFVATPLAALPLMSAFVASNVCGSMLPREYNERTVYLSLPLPMSRFTFYIGKFLAGLTLSLGVVAAAYGISILMALFMAKTTVTYSGALFGSLLISMAAMFFFCSFIYMLSASSKRGSTMKGLILLFVALPVLVIIVNALPNLEFFESVKGPLETMGGYLLYLPVFAPDLALNNLGTTAFASTFGINCVSIYSFVSMLLPAKLDITVVQMTAVSLVLGILCLIRGFSKVKRRDM
ncbi:MAG: ABC transporter permease [Candidatus Methanomethylophilaceae archaeon]